MSIHLSWIAKIDIWKAWSKFRLVYYQLSAIIVSELKTASSIRASDLIPVHTDMTYSAAQAIWIRLMILLSVNQSIKLYDWISFYFAGVNSPACVWLASSYFEIANISVYVRLKLKTELSLKPAIIELP